jgi:hypothetical protein
MRIKNFGQFINEGGKVFDEDTRKIKKEEVGATMVDIEKNLFPSIGLDLKDNVIKIGSAGHADVSGDIDFGVVGRDLDEIHETLSKKFPDRKTNFIKGLEVLSIEWPIAGTKDLVQVDFIPVYDRDWTEFIYKYPEGSKYKSAHRNWLLMSILSVIRNNEKNAEGGEPLSYDGFMLNLNKGLFSMTKNYQGKTKVLKHGEIDSEELVTTKPKKFVDFVFGPYFEPKNVSTFENCWKIINDKHFRWFDKLDDIKKNFVKFLERAGLEIPEEVR